MPRQQTDAAAEELERAKAIGRRLEIWFATNARDFPWREWRDPYRVAVTEILLQRTKAEVVGRFVSEFFRAYPDWTTLASANEDDLRQILAPIGLHRTRAAALQALAAAVVDAPIPRWASLPGIGQYVARAIAVSVAGASEAMVDANFVRLLHRVFDGPWMADYRYDRRLQALAQAVVEASSDARSVNWAVLDLGATVCSPRRPGCDRCPLSTICRWNGAPSAATAE